MSDRVIRYSPKAERNNAVAQAVYGVDKDLLDEASAIAKEVFDSQFIQTTGIKGVRRYEKLFNLSAGPNDTLEQRKQAVLNKISYRPPFTRQTTGEMLDTLWGPGNYVYEIIPSDFQMIVDIDTDDPESYLKFQKELRRNIPANISLVMLLQYIHAYLKKYYTYGELNRKFTYEELSYYANPQ